MTIMLIRGRVLVVRPQLSVDEFHWLALSSAVLKEENKSLFIHFFHTIAPPAIKLVIFFF